MDILEKILETQLREREFIIYQLVESGMSYRDLGQRLGISHATVGKIYSTAKAKIQKLADAGLMETAVDNLQG